MSQVLSLLFCLSWAAAHESAIRAVRRRHYVGGGAPINPIPRSRRPPKNVFQRFPKNFPSILKIFWWPFFSHRKLNCNKISTQQQWHRRRTDKLSAARRSTKVGGGAHKLAAAARPAHGSKCDEALAPSGSRGVHPRSIGFGDGRPHLFQMDAFPHLFQISPYFRTVYEKFSFFNKRFHFIHQNFRWTYFSYSL